LSTSILSKAAIVCEHIARRSASIRKAVHEEAVESLDSGWQFYCGLHEIESDQNAEIWMLEEVLHHEPSLAVWIDFIGDLEERLVLEWLDELQRWQPIVHK
jgi:hypothetical protein